MVVTHGGQRGTYEVITKLKRTYSCDEDQKYQIRRDRRFALTSHGAVAFDCLLRRDLLQDPGLAIVVAQSADLVLEKLCGVMSWNMEWICPIDF